MHRILWVAALCLVAFTAQPAQAQSQLETKAKQAIIVEGQHQLIARECRAVGCPHVA